MNDIVLRNRQFGPEASLQLVEERAPNGFDRIEEVISREDLENITGSFSAAAGLDVEPSTQGGHSSTQYDCSRAQLYAFTDLTGRFAPEAAGPERLFRSVASMAAKNSK